VNRTITVTRPRERAPLFVLPTRTGVVDVDIRDHDGTFLCAANKHAFTAGGAVFVEVATTHYAVYVENDRPSVRLHWGDLAAMRINNTARYWLGVA